MQKSVSVSVLRILNQALDRTVGLRIAPGSRRKITGIEDEAWSVMSRVSGRTMGSALQQYSMWLASNYVEDNNVPGAIVEFGVWRGGMSMIGAEVVRQRNSTRTSFLFDTFEGMTEPTSRDVEMFSGRSASHLLSRERKRSMGKSSYNTWCIADSDDVRSGFDYLGIPSSQYRLVKGDVMNTVPTEVPDCLAICRVDTDWYESTRHILENCWDRISPGGVLLLDDYDAWSGSRTATDEFFRSRDLFPLMSRCDYGRVVVKGSE